MQLVQASILQARKRRGAKNRGRPGAPYSRSLRGRLRSWIRVTAAEDVAVAERRRTVLLRGWPRNARIAGREGLPPGIDRRAIGGVAHVVPDRRAEGPRCNGVDIVAEELADKVVLTRATRVTVRTSAQLGECSGWSTGAHRGVCMLHDPDQVPERC